MRTSFRVKWLRFPVRLYMYLYICECIPHNYVHRVYYRKSLLTSGYTSNRRCVVTGIPARAERNTSGSTKRYACQNTMRCTEQTDRRTDVHENDILVMLRLHDNLSPAKYKHSFDTKSPYTLTSGPRQANAPTFKPTDKPPHSIHQMALATHRMIPSTQIPRGTTHPKEYLVIHRSTALEQLPVQRPRGCVERAGVQTELTSLSRRYGGELGEAHVIADSETDAREGGVEEVDGRSAGEGLAFLSRGVSWGMEEKGGGGVL